MPDGSQQLDINGRPISPRRRRWGMNVNILCCALGTFWAVSFWPGSALFSMFMQDRLGATTTQIGFFSAIAGLGMMFQFLGVFIFDRTRTRKVAWVTMVLSYRFVTIAGAAFAIYAHMYGSSSTLIWAMLAVLGASFSVATMASNAWWTWIADLAPDSVRGQFLGRRQIAAAISTLIGQSPVLLLGKYGKDAAGNYTDAADWIFISIFVLCTLSGMLDIIFHAFIPEPARQDRPEKVSFRDTSRNFLEPLQNRNFRRFIVAQALNALSMMFWAPFVWPYLIDKTTINCGYNLYFVANVVSTLVTLVSSRYWGLLIDRYGAKPIVALTSLAGLSAVYLLFINHDNAFALIVALSVLGGFLWGGNNLAGAQLMLSLSPQKNRNAYVATYASLCGLTLFVGPWLAGWFGEQTKLYLAHLDYQWVLTPTGTVVTYMQVLAVIAVVMRIFFLPLLLRVKEGDEKPIGLVLATLVSTSQFRTLYAMRMIAGRDTSKKLSVLRGLESPTDRLAVEDLIRQVHDADPRVRHEAAMALGRVGGPEAVATLTAMLNDPQGDLRAEAAAALGLTADSAAVAPLLARIDDPDVAVREQVAGALGELQAPEAAEPLVALLKRDESPAVFGRAAQALARLGVIDAIWDIVPRMHRTANLGLRRELATAIGNVLGSPGQFYVLLNDELRRPGRRAAALARTISRRLLCRAGTLAKTGQTNEGQHLKTAAKAIRQAGRDATAGRHGEALDLMQRGVLEILSGLYDFAGPDELAEEFALSRSSRLGAGLWMLQNAGEYARGPQPEPEMVRLDALLGLYAIGEFIERSPVLKGRTWPLADRVRAWFRPRPGRARQRVLTELRRIERENAFTNWASRPKTAARLVALLDDAEPAVRREAALALGRFGGDLAVETLLARLDDPDCDLQAEVVMALGLTGDARAADPLLAKLASPNEIIREYAAHALGELGRPEVAQALMELVRRDPSPNVFGRGALALARLGALEAVWEIMPRMHQSHDVGLRRQLAMAVGNLIGRPGEFYDLLNEEIHKPGSRVVEIARQTATVLRRKAKRSQAGPQADQAPHLLISAQQGELAAEEFEFQRYDLALEQQVTATLEMLRALYNLKSSQAVAVEWVLERNRELGLGLWWLEKALDQARQRRSSPETLHLDTLLGFHFLHSFARALEK